MNFVSEKYCSDLGGVFEEGVPCFDRTDAVCGAGVSGACCTGVDEDTLDGTILCDPSPEYDDTINCDDIFGKLPPGEEGTVGFPEYLQCIKSGCESCCEYFGNSFPFCEGPPDENCTFNTSKCCIETFGICVPVNYACHCESMGGREVSTYVGS